MTIIPGTLWYISPYAVVCYDSIIFIQNIPSVLEYPAS